MLDITGTRADRDTQTFCLGLSLDYGMVMYFLNWWYIVAIPTQGSFIICAPLTYNQVPLMLENSSEDHQKNPQRKLLSFSLVIVWSWHFLIFFLPFKFAWNGCFVF